MAIEKNMNKKNGKAVPLAVATVHILMAVIYRLFFYECSEEYKEWFIYGKQAFPSLISDRTERIICTLLSFAIGVLLIFVIWRILCRAWHEKRKAVFIIIGISVIAACIVYPQCFFNYESDDVLLYYMAVRDVLDYWNGCYVTCIYNACLMVFPSPFIFPILQCSALLGTIYYISLRFRRLYSVKVSLLPWALLLFPEMQRIAFDPYRNCINTVMCLALFAIVFCDAVEGKKRMGREIVLFCICIGFLTVFRSEQILHMFLLLLAIRFVYQCSIKKSFCFLGIMVVSCLVFMLPQKLGEQKYYGKDYSMINSMNTLSVILSDESADLSYEGVDEDLAAIEAIVPIDKIKSYGLAGYRGHVFAKNRSVNQSFALKEKQEAFIRGGNSLIFHNLDIYFKARMKTFMDACGRESSLVKEEEQKEIGEEELETIQEIVNMQQAYMDAVNFGISEVQKDTIFAGFFFQEDKLQAALQVVLLFYKELNWLGQNGVILAVRGIVFLIFPIIILYSLKEGILERKRAIFWFGTTCLLYGQIAGIFLMCPEGRPIYYYPVFFTMLLGNAVLFLNYNQKKQAAARTEAAASEVKQDS